MPDIVLAGNIAFISYLISDLNRLSFIKLICFLCISAISGKYMHLQLGAG